MTSPHYVGYPWYLTLLNGVEACQSTVAQSSTKQGQAGEGKKGDLCGERLFHPYLCSHSKA